MPNPYKPINCDFHELLLAKATLREECEITYFKNNESTTEISTITDVYTSKGEEFMVLKSGTVVRLDYIVSVNNNNQPNFTCSF